MQQVPCSQRGLTIAVSCTLASEVFMAKILINPGFALRAVALGALAVGATAIGAVAIGVMSIRKLRLFEGRLEKLYIQRLTIGELDVQSARTAATSPEFSTPDLTSTL
jgi:hypothetical protein